MRRRYVRREPSPPPLPKGAYRDARTFVDADGTAYDVVALPTPEWPMGSSSTLSGQTPGRLHLKGERL